MTSAIDVDRLAEVCQRYGIARLEVFGSVARGTATPNSDVDLLYTLHPDAHLGWEIADLTDELQAIFHRPVDLISRNALHERIRPAAEAESSPIYAAA